MICKEGLAVKLKDLGVPSFRAKQIIHAVYKEGKADFVKISVLPKSLQTLLSQQLKIYSFDFDDKEFQQNSETVKALFKLKDNETIESVLMQFKDSRKSVCVSSQVGCPLKCAFCATGAMGFKRNLNYEEIADQVLYFDQRLKKKNSKVSHVVFMGMGEPFLNYDNVMAACRILNDPECLGIAARHITISSSGVVPGIRKFALEKEQFNLAISLHAPTQELRAKLMPIACSYGLNELMAAINDYIEKTGRRVSYEYIMLKDVNDSENHARQLSSLIKGQLCHVNLIPYNETKLGFQSPGKPKTDAFKHVLDSFGIPVTVRVSMGQKINAACGQLATVRDCCSPCNRH